MTVLSDHTLRQYIASGHIGWTWASGEVIETPLIQPASVDMTLGDTFRTLRNHTVDYIDLVERPDLTELHVTTEFVLHPGEFALATTRERVIVPRELAAQVNGKSSLGRLGLSIHVTAGFIDPGFSGQITLELSNLLRIPIKLRRGMPIAQICFMRLDLPCCDPYGSESLGSHYQNQTGPTPSRLNSAT